MKKQPLNNQDRPVYPTLNQVRNYSTKSKVTKIAAVTALTASMALTAGCGSDSRTSKSKGFFEGIEDFFDSIFGGELAGETTVQIQGETDGPIVEGEIESTTESYVLMGEETVCTEPELEGEETVSTELELSGDVAYISETEATEA